MITIECVMCGYCCDKVPCCYGAPTDSGGCVFLSEPNETGQRFCKKYKEIAADPGSWASPAFGAGCSSSLYNDVRDDVLYRQAMQDTINAMIDDGIVRGD